MLPFTPLDPPSPSVLEEQIQSIAAKHPLITYTVFGNSIEGRPLYCLRIGKGKKHLLYIGTHHGMEWLTATLLVRFAEDVACHANGMVYGASVDYLLQTRTFFLVPMLNPDGVHLQMNGSDIGELLHARKMRMNGGRFDFSHWQANARGVDLNHNYDAGFAEYAVLAAQKGIEAGPTRYQGTHPASEPETAALLSLIQTVSPSLMLTLHTQGEEIYAPMAAASPDVARMAESLAVLSGYRFTKPTDALSAYGGLSDYAAGCNIPCFTVECGKGENPLSFALWQPIYQKLRRMFFCAARLI